MPEWRAANHDDVTAIAAISAIVLADYPEEPAIFAELLRLSPAGCFVLEDAEGMAGYLVGHPWTRLSPPPLNTPLGRLPDAPDCWYIHDLSLLPRARGTGASAAGIALAAHAALNAGLPLLSIVAVNNAGGFWKKQGFTETGGEVMASRIASYGADALYMERAA